MKERNSRYIGISALLLSIIVTELVILRVVNVGRSDLEIVLSNLWVVAPYIGLILGDVLVRVIKVIPKITWIFCVVSILMLLFTTYAYVGIIGDKSSTAGLIFVFLPLYLNVLVMFLVGTGLVWAAISKSSEK